MIVHLDHSLKILGLSGEQARLLEKTLSLRNPAYDVMVRHKNIKALYAIKEYFKYYKKIDGGYEVGRGVLARVRRHWSEEISMTTWDLSTSAMKVRLKPDGIKLRDYQEGCIGKILKHTEGIINLGTGFGKTEVALKLVEETGCRTLIIVPRLSILAQFKSALKKYYDYDSGIINGKTWDIKDITLATVQTLKQRDLKDIKDHFSMVIYDEAHQMISAKGIKLITSFNPFRLYALTASPDRSDGQGEAIKFYFGDIIISDELPQCKPSVELVKYNGTYFGDDYAEIVKLQTEDVERNKLIVKIIKEELLKGRRVLVLTKRVLHYETLESMLVGHRCFTIKSGLKTSEQNIQDSLLEKLRSGAKDFDTIMGTFSMLSTGVNIPALDTLIIAGDLKSDVLSKQAVGRILRIFEDKKDPKIIDIIDAGSGILNNQARLRRKFYKENNFVIL